MASTPVDFGESETKLAPTPAVKPADQDLAARRPVWEALSELFLDTDVSVGRQWRIERLAASPYEVDEIEHILVDEVYPVCKYNLLSVAGVWDGFDLPWLEAQILKRLRSRLRPWHRLSLGRRVMGRSSEWRATKEGTLAARRPGRSA